MIYKCCTLRESEILGGIDFLKMRNLWKCNLGIKLKLLEYDNYIKFTATAGHSFKINKRWTKFVHSLAKHQNSLVLLIMVNNVFKVSTALSEHWNITILLMNSSHPALTYKKSVCTNYGCKLHSRFYHKTMMIAMDDNDTLKKILFNLHICHKQLFTWIYTVTMLLVCIYD